MYKKTITYTNFDGVERTEDFYFNLTPAEITEMDLCFNGGLQTIIEKITKETNGRVLVEIFKDLIRRAYGEKSIDGMRFMKNKEITDSFTATNAYSELFMEFVQDADSAAEFINGIIPQVPDNKSPIPAPAH